MNIQTVANNLRATIAGKEQHLKTLGSDLLCGDYVDRTATMTTIEFLKINLTELKRILQDMEQCIPKEPDNRYKGYVNERTN